MSKSAIAALCVALLGAIRMPAQASPVAAPSPATTIVNYADADPKPVMLSQVRPVYPPDLRAAGMQGNAVVDFVIDPSGVPTKITIAHQTNAEFGAAAMASVARWRFSPGGMGGAKVWVHIQIPIVFSIEKAAADDSPNLPPMADLPPGDPVFDISKVDNRPTAVFQVRPLYPASLRASGTSGHTLILFVVRANGRVSNVRVVSATNPLFGAAGVDAVRRWRFHPARLANQAVNCQLEVPLEFSLTH